MKHKKYNTNSPRALHRHVRITREKVLEECFGEWSNGWVSSIPLAKMFLFNSTKSSFSSSHCSDSSTALGHIDSGHSSTCTTKHKSGLMLRLKHIILYVSGLKYLSSLLSYMPHPFFCSHHQGSTPVIGWGFWGISIPGRLCFALCKVLVQCHLHRLSQCSVPQRGRNTAEITRVSSYFFFFFARTALDQVRGIQKSSLTFSSHSAGHCVEAGLNDVDTNIIIKIEEHSTQRKWIHFLPPWENSYSLSDRLRFVLLWADLLCLLAIFALDDTVINMDIEEHHLALFCNANHVF